MCTPLLMALASPLKIDGRGDESMVHRVKKHMLHSTIPLKYQ